MGQPQPELTPKPAQPGLALKRPAGRVMVADTALRLARHFGMSADFWLGLQMQYELERAENEIGEKLDREVVRLAG